MIRAISVALMSAPWLSQQRKPKPTMPVRGTAMQDMLPHPRSLQDVGIGGMAPDLAARKTDTPEAP